MTSRKPTPPAPATPPQPPIAIPLRWVRVAHHGADHIAARYPYAAFGSNLSLAQMARRCPAADPMGAGMLRGARLVFARYLGIVEDQAATTLVGVYRLTAPDIAALDRFEGHGRHYDRYLVTVELNGDAVRCFTYVKRDNAPRAPSEAYYATCLQGFNDWAFDARRLRHARAFAAKHEKPLPPTPPRGGGRGAFDFADWYRASFTERNAGKPDHNAVPEAGPHVSLVTGRMLPGKPAARRLEDMRPDEIRAALDAQRPAARPIGAQAEWTDDKGRTWRRDPRNVWRRVRLIDRQAARQPDSRKRD